MRLTTKGRYALIIARESLTALALITTVAILFIALYALS